MLQLLKPQKTIIKVLGEQAYLKGTNYRLINYAISEKVNDGVLLFNNLTKEMYLLTNEEFTLLNDISTLNEGDVFDQLVKGWFFVPQENNDYELCEQVRNILLLLEKNEGINYFTILPTTGCNARCFYCFEAGTPVVNMDEKAAEATADFIIKNCNGKRVVINWFGGEPLCNYKAIDIISTKLKENNIDYLSRMVSNSYIFNEELISRAKELWHLQNVHVTLDGMPETYNKIKNYVNNDANAFDRVVKNIKELTRNKIVAIVRMNLGKYNSEELYQLVDYLAEEFVGNKYFNLYVTPLYEGEAYADNKRTKEEHFQISKYITDMSFYIKSKGFTSRNSSIKSFPIRHCQADKQSAVLIVPDGHLAFCEHYLNDDFYGSVFEDAKPKPFWSDYREPQKECYTCPIWPNCRYLKRCPNFGGECYEYDRTASILRTKDNMVMEYNRFLKNKNKD